MQRKLSEVEKFSELGSEISQLVKDINLDLNEFAEIDREASGEFASSLIEGIEERVRSEKRKFEEIVFRLGQKNELSEEHVRLLIITASLIRKTIVSLVTNVVLTKMHAYLTRLSTVDYPNNEFKSKLTQLAKTMVSRLTSNEVDGILGVPPDDSFYYSIIYYLTINPSYSANQKNVTIKDFCILLRETIIERQIERQSIDPFKLQELPDEVINVISQQLSNSSLTLFRKTCKRMYKVPIITSSFLLVRRFLSVLSELETINYKDNELAVKICLTYVKTLVKEHPTFILINVPYREQQISPLKFVFRNCQIVCLKLFYNVMKVKDRLKEYGEQLREQMYDIDREKYRSLSDLNKKYFKQLCAEFEIVDLVKVVSEGDISQVSALLEKGIDPNFMDLDSKTPLRAAFEKGHFDIFKLLLENGAMPNSKNNVSILLEATHASKNDYIELLILFGADPNQVDPDDNNYSLIDIAATERNLEIVKLLLSYGAIPSNVTLAIAVIEGDKNIVEFLIEHGVDPNELDHWDSLPIHLAVENGHVEIVKLLLSFKPDISIKDEAGDTVLDIACKEGDKTIIELLEEYAENNMRNESSSSRKFGVIS